MIESIDRYRFASLGMTHERVRWTNGPKRSVATWSRKQFLPAIEPDASRRPALERAMKTLTRPQAD